MKKMLYFSGFAISVAFILVYGSISTFKKFFEGVLDADEVRIVISFFYNF